MLFSDLESSPADEFEAIKHVNPNSGVNVSDHFVDVNKMVNIGSDTTRQIKDIALTRQLELDKMRELIKE